ncbi:tRNA pseudouridine synthase 1 [Sparassis crispa]|uniref:tRNA pseudouridine synthase 1 n=1 Tax=Sparassis crispa TaxID=139825 RepID=A0A401GWQ5_9APHY|nr:tRNA pseudouridine synthase 1 [Sparassis crispa]GBE86651.1 tRNA pseudouridine synthase 1 [Sparassis crispa]
MEVHSPELSSGTSPSLKRPREDDNSPSASTSKRVKIDPEPTTGSGEAVAEPVDLEHRKKSAGEAEVAPHRDDDKGGRQRKGKAKEKRDSRRGTRNETAAEHRDNGEPKAARLPKAKSAMLIGFCGSGYQGMQMQYEAHVKTIEGTLFDALVRIGAVSKDNADDHAKVALHRAARTDAGVHAAGNLVSLKLITEIPGVPDFVARVNEELPPEIRLWSVSRVQRSFDARALCDSRKYTYFFPSYMLVPPKPGCGLERTLREHGYDEPLHPFWAEAGSESTVEDDLSRKRAYRVPSEKVDELRVMAKKFEGTHNFHNLTIGRDFNDRSCHRLMKSIEVADPQVYNNTQWISVLFHGQSFMLHQIRLMMSVLILSCHTGTSPQLIDELYGPRKVRIPKTPALGLLLEYPIFGSYNKRIAAANEGVQQSDPAYRPPIDFEIHREALDRFKQEHIYSRMRSIEEQEGMFDAWIRHIDGYAGDDFLYLNPKGIIPAAAVLKKGEQRSNPFKEKRRFDSTVATVDSSGEAAIEEREEEEDAKVVLDHRKLADMEG